MIKLLIAEDEETERTGLKNLVESFGLGLHICAVAEDGQQALDLAKEFLPEILLVDINMPRLSGLEFIERLRSILPDSKVIIISGYGEFSYAQRAVELHVFRYLLKPVSHAELFNTLNRAMEAYTSRLWELNQIGSELTDAGASAQLPSRILHHIDTHYADETMDLQSLAVLFSVSKSSLSRMIRQYTGKSFPTYLTDLRMKQAEHLLSDSRGRMVYEVAGMVGYSSQHYFCKVFKEYTGFSPSEYRERTRRSQE